VTFNSADQQFGQPKRQAKPEQGAPPSRTQQIIWWNEIFEVEQINLSLVARLPTHHDPPPRETNKAAESCRAADPKRPASTSPMRRTGCGILQLRLTDPPEWNILSCDPIRYPANSAPAGGGLNANRSIQTS
jgi:hypothetical protein